MARLEETRRKVEDGVRLSREEGIALLREGDFLELGTLADAVRERLHPEGAVTYIIDRNINYTNVCVAQCAFCAFYRDLPSKQGYLLSKAELAHLVRLYDGNLAFADQELGALRGSLEALGLWERTVVIVAADHGNESPSCRLVE